MKAPFPFKSPTMNQRARSYIHSRKVKIRTSPDMLLRVFIRVKIIANRSYWYLKSDRRINSEIKIAYLTVHSLSEKFSH